MTEKSWPWSTAAGLGDGAAELNEALSREFLALYFGVQDPTTEGVSKGVLGELAVSGSATPLTVQDGSGICYGLYINDAPVNLAVSTPAVGTTGGRVVLQTNWAGTGGGSLEARTRLAVIMSADGVAAPPALTQSFGITWEISLATFTITTGGVITVTDARTFRRSTAVVGSAEIDNDSVGNAELRNSAAVSVVGRAENSTGDPADIAAGANDRVLGRTGDALSFVQLTLGMFVDGVITLAKLANLAGVSLLGRAANSPGVMGAITAAANDRLLARTSDALSFVQLTIGMIPDLLITEAKLAAAAAAKLVTNGNSHDHVGGDGAAISATAGLANDIVDDTKVGNRVPQFYRRQGGSASVWSTAGTTTQTPTTVRQQGGAIVAAVGAGQAVVFPTAFSQAPLVFVIPLNVGTPLVANVASVTASGFTVRVYFTDGSEADGQTIYWFAVGPE